MTAAPPANTRLTMDVSGTKPIPFSRLVAVELRKTADTRAGRWLLGAIVGVTALFMVIFYFAASDADRSFGNFIGISSTPQGFVLPVLGILLVTSEWSQRTAMVTFALAPSRGAVIAAKTVAALILGLGAYVAAIVIGAIATVLSGTEGGFADLQLGLFLVFLAIQLFTVLQGLAYGLIFLNTPAAIVVFFVLPIASSIVFSVVSALQDIAPWIDLGTAQSPLFQFGGDVSLTGEQYGQLATSTVIWIIIPFVVGLWRVMRAEVK